MKQRTKEVKDFDINLKKLVDDMYDTLYYIGNGVGLSGNQIGESKSIIVIDLSADEKHKNSNPLTLINPLIEHFSEEEVEDQEGCLSIPEYYEKVKRSKDIRVKFYDIKGREKVIDIEDFLARVIQHEVDHLNGLLIFDRISPLKRALSKNKLKKIQKGETVQNYQMILPDGNILEQKKKS